MCARHLSRPDTFSCSDNKTHVHGGVDLCHRFVVRGELVDLDAVAHQLAHDFNLELVQLALGNRVGFRDNGDDVHLQTGRDRHSVLQ